MQIKRNIVNILMTFLFLFILQSIVLSSEKITIVYTNSLNGWIDFCHCKGNPKGGLVKRATEIKKIRKKYNNLFLFETGDFFLPDNDLLLAGNLIKGYKYINYDAVQFGDQEFSIGIKEFLKYTGALPFVCNNIRIKKDNRYKSYFKRFLIIQKNKFQAGVIGTISKDSFKYSPYSESRSASPIRVLEQFQEIKKDIKELKKKGVDIIILLSHSGFERDKEIASRLREIDVIIGGHSQTLLKKPYYNGKTIIVQAGADGAHIGILELSRKNGKTVYFKNSFRRPDDKHPEDDVYIRRLINNYKKELKKKQRKLKFDS